MDIKTIVEKLIDPFLKAGDLSISLREKGLKKEIKSDNTPVSNGDLEVNKFIIKKISEINEAVRAAIKCNKPAVVDVDVDPSALYSFRRDSFKHRQK